MSTREALAHLKAQISDMDNPTESQSQLLKSFCDVMLGRAEKGELEAQLALGALLSKDELHVAEAFRWYKRAADEHGHPHAQYAVGVIYLTGKLILQIISAFC